jgi:hypothetical protein
LNLQFPEDVSVLIEKSLRFLNVWISCQTWGRKQIPDNIEKKKFFTVLFG